MSQYPKSIWFPIFTHPNKRRKKKGKGQNSLCLFTVEKISRGRIYWDLLRKVGIVCIWMGRDNQPLQWLESICELCKRRPQAWITEKREGMVAHFHQRVRKSGVLKFSESWLCACVSDSRTSANTSILYLQPVDLLLLGRPAVGSGSQQHLPPALGSSHSMASSMLQAPKEWHQSYKHHTCKELMYKASNVHIELTAMVHLKMTQPDWFRKIYPIVGTSKPSLTQLLLWLELEINCISNRVHIMNIIDDDFQKHTQEVFK